jgi:Phytanoyl-CoA dioxygenase (PhyH)
MRVTDAQLAELTDVGFTRVEGFIPAAELAEAQAALWSVFPKPADYFADPAVHARFAKSQFAGIRHFPLNIPIFDRLCVLPGLVDAAERVLGSSEIDLYKIELWAKYAGAIDYDQPHHRDYGNHTIVVPHPDRPQLTTIMLLSDVTEADAPTCAVPLAHTRDIPTTPMIRAPGELTEHEVVLTGAAGTLILYQTHVFHRGSNFTRPDASRFIYMTDFKRRGDPWTGKQAWPDHALRPGWTEALTAMSVRQRELFGFPPPGSDYWTPVTLAGVAARYPQMDMTPYQ